MTEIVIRIMVDGDRATVAGITATGETASFAVCRRLIAAGFDPASPVEVAGPDGRLRYRITSLQAGAVLTVVDDSRGFPRFVRYVPFNRHAVASGRAIDPPPVSDIVGTDTAAETRIFDGFENCGAP